MPHALSTCVTVVRLIDKMTTTTRIKDFMFSRKVIPHRLSGHLIMLIFNFMYCLRATSTVT